jgi:hypothetical protein
MVSFCASVFIHLYSEVEEEDTPLCSMQAEAMKHVSTEPIVPAVQPQTMTSKLFFPKTAGMDSGFLAFDDAKCTGNTSDIFL